MSMSNELYTITKYYIIIGTFLTAINLNEVKVQRTKKKVDS